MLNTYYQKALLVLTLISFPFFCCAQRNFTGTITYNFVEEETVEFYENMQFLKRKEPYERYLSGTKVYTISGDTLVSELIDNLGERFYVAVQIGEEVYFDTFPFDGGFKNVSTYKTSLELVETWQRCRRCEDELPAAHLKSYLGEPKDSKNTLFQIHVDDRSKFPEQFALAGIFRDVFTARGLIRLSSRTYKEEVTTRTLQKDGVKPNAGSCRQKLMELNW